MGLHEGIKVSTGEHFLFLDADVRLGPGALEELFCTYQGTPISIQPHHTTKTIYEQGSLFFNMVQVAANGTALKRPNHIGLFGPLILISKNHYELIGGHEAIKDSIIEDVSMGQLLKEHNIPFKVFIGDEVISFRMYGNGFKGLVEGWTKNLASGALTTPWFRGLLVFFWIASLTSIPIQLIRYGISGSIPFLIFYAVFYLIW
jgi:4,4'-diaponeurosporenoate glycosyltransferase